MPVLGCVYQASDGYYYVAVGQKNPEESRSKVVVRIIKFDSSWKEVGHCDYQANQVNVYEGITEPFRSSSPEMTDLDGILYLHMGRKMFVRPDGLNHQTGLTLGLDMAAMTPVETGKKHDQSEKGIIQPYCAHSFRQLVGTDGNAVYFASLGDAYPRAIQLHIAWPDGTYQESQVFTINGETGDNFTGTLLGDMQVTNDVVLLAGSSEPHSIPVKGVTSTGSFTARMNRNLFVVAANKTSKGAEFSWITTNHPVSSSISYGAPRLVKVSSNRYVLLASLFDSDNPDTDYTHYFVLDGKGNVLTDYIYENIPFQDGQQPVYFNNSIYWLVNNDTEKAVLYTIPYVENKSSIDYDPSMLKEGWIKQNGFWRYQLKGGALIRSESKEAYVTREIDGHTYGFDYDGNMITGWKKDAGGYWTYFKSDGALFESADPRSISWIRIQGKWYAFRESRMITSEWAIWENGDKTSSYYYLGSDGAMVSNKWIQPQTGVWYYLTTDGTPKIGWLNQGGTSYYFYPSGIMAADTWVEGYKLKADGSWDQLAGYHPEHNQNHF